MKNIIQISYLLQLLILGSCSTPENAVEGEKENSNSLSISSEEMKKLNDREAIIVCQCRSGKRSLTAASQLQGEGFENLFNLEGGILAWIENGYPTK